MKQDSNLRLPARVCRHELAQFTRFCSVNHLGFIHQIVKRFTSERVYVEALQSYAVLDEALLSSSVGTVRYSLQVLYCIVEHIVQTLALPKVETWGAGGGRHYTVNSPLRTHRWAGGTLLQRIIAADIPSGSSRPRNIADTCINILHYTGLDQNNN